jgi:hypothetical protein
MCSDHHQTLVVEKLGSQGGKKKEKKILDYCKQ